MNNHRTIRIWGYTQHPATARKETRELTPACSSQVLLRLIIRKLRPVHNRHLTWLCHTTTYHTCPPKTSEVHKGGAAAPFPNPVHNWNHIDELCAMAIPYILRAQLFLFARSIELDLCVGIGSDPIDAGGQAKGPSQKRCRSAVRSPIAGNAPNRARAEPPRRG